MYLSPTGSAVEMSAARTGLVTPGVISHYFVLGSDVFIPASARPRVISDVRAAVVGTGPVLAGICRVRAAVRGTGPVLADICRVRAAVIGTRPVLAGIPGLLTPHSRVPPPC